MIFLLHAKESRQKRGSQGLCFCGSFHRRDVLHHGGLSGLGAALVDVSGIGVNILCTLADGGDRLHHVLLDPRRGGGGVRIDLFGILAGKKLQTGCSDQNACCELTCVFHVNDLLLCALCAVSHT